MQKEIQEIGMRLKKARLARELSQQDLAKMSGLSITTVSMSERRGPATMQAVVKMASALGVDEKFVFQGVVPEWMNTHPELEHLPSNDEIIVRRILNKAYPTPSEELLLRTLGVTPRATASA